MDSPLLRILFLNDVTRQSEMVTTNTTIGNAVEYGRRPTFDANVVIFWDAETGRWLGSFVRWADQPALESERIRLEE